MSVDPHGQDRSEPGGLIDPDEIATTRSPRVLLRLLGIAALLAVALAAAFPGVLFGDRTLSASAYVSGVEPRDLGVVGKRPQSAAEMSPARGEGADSVPAPLVSPPARPEPAIARPQVPAKPHLLDPEGAAWVDEPSPYLVNRALVEGHLPLWNADEGLGAPLAANLNASVWAPFALPMNLHPTPLVQDLTWIGRVWVLGYLTAWLGLELGLGTVGALGAGLALMLSGQTIRWIAHHPLHTDVFVPLALVGALRVLDRRIGGTTLLSAAIAAALLGGKPQSALVAGCFGGLWLLAYAGSRGRAAWSRMPVLALAAVLGVALAAVALLPFAETYLGASGLVRGGRSAQGVAELSLAGLAGLASPTLSAWIGRVTGVATPSEGAWLEPSLPHAGLIPLALALLGLVWARRRPLAWALAATIAFYVARVHFGSFAWLGGLPLLRSVSFVKYCFPLYLAVALLAGLATSRARWAAVLLAFMAAELLLLVPRGLPERVDPFAPAPYVEVLRSFESERPGRISGAVELMPPLVSNALGFMDLRAINVLTPQPTYDFVSRLVAPSEGLIWILADPDPLLVATSPGADLANVRWVLARTPLDPARLPDAVRAQVSARRLVRLFDVLRFYSIDSAHVFGGIRTLGGDRRFHWTCTTPCTFTMDSSALPPRLALGLATAAASHVEVRIDLRDAAGATAPPAHAALDLGPPRDAWRDLWVDSAALAGKRGTVRIDLTAATPTEVFLGGLGPSPGADEEQQAVARELAIRTEELAHVRLRSSDATALIYENEDALPQAYVATSLGRSGSLEDLYTRLETSPGDATAIALESDVAGTLLDGEAAPRAWPDRSGGAAEIVSGRDSELQIHADAPEGGVLVVARLPASGWRATLDGVRVPIVPVNGALTGIVLPPGAHDVRLLYSPTWLRIGAAVSALALALWFGVIVRALGAPLPCSSSRRSRTGP